MTLEQFLAEWHDDKPQLLVSTSGSTGRPRPMWIEKQRMLNSARMTCDFLGLRPGNTALLCMPLDYIAGKMMVVRSVERGLRLIDVPPSSHPLAHAGVPDEIDFAAMVPMQVSASLERPDERRRLSKIGQLIIGGGPIDSRLARELRSFPNAVWSTYGMTETLSHIALRRLNGPAATEWYSALPGVSLSLGSDGCLTVDAPRLNPHLLHTNDLAELRVDTAGRLQFRIIGRKDNVINSGGIKLQIEEIERLLRPHLSARFMITKCADPRLGEAVVLLTEGEPTAELQDMVRRVLPKYHSPRHYLHVARLPLTATGKPARAVAEELAAAILGEAERG